MDLQKLIEQRKRTKVEALARAHFKQDQNGSNRYVPGQFPLSIADYALREYSQCLDLDDPIFNPENISWRSKDVMYGAIHLSSYFRLNHPSHPGQIDPPISHLDLKEMARQFQEAPLLYYVNTLMEVVYSTIVPWTDQEYDAIFTILVMERDEAWQNMRPGKECSDITIRDPDYKKKYATDRALENLPSMLKHFGYEMKGRLDVESEVSRKLTSLLFDYPIREDSSPTRPSFSYLKERVKAKYGA